MLFLICTMRRIYPVSSGCMISEVMVQLPVSGGSTGSIAFSCGDFVIHDSLANSLHHPIHACAHSCLDGCGKGSGVCDGGIARARLSSFRVPGVDDDEDDACMDGNNSSIQSFGCHATACACLDALQNSRRVRGHWLR